MDPEVSSRIFISYRREDSAGHVLALLPALRRHFGSDRIFKDTDNIPPGEDFLKFIRKELDTCSVLLAIIGREWLTIQDSRLKKRRLDNEEDFLRVEVSTALKNERIRVIPVLIERAMMPAAQELPPDLADLQYRNAIELSDIRWESDVQLLIQAIERAAADSAAKPKAPIRPELAELEKRRTREIAGHLSTARDAFETDDFDTALAACEKALLIDPKRMDVLELMDRVGKARDEQRIDGWLREARQAMGQGDFVRASDLIDQALSVDSKSEPALQLRNEMLDRRRERDRERERARALQAAIDRAQSAFDDEDYDTAVRHADDALVIDPDSADAQAVRAKAVAAIEERRKQRELKRRAQQAVSEARAKFSAGEHEHALRLLREFSPAHEIASTACVELEAEFRTIEERRRQAEEEAKQEEIRRAQAEAERAAAERALAEKRAREERERQEAEARRRAQAKKEEEERRLKAEAELKQKEEEERRRKEEALRLQKEKEEEARRQKIREEEERRLKAEAERKQKEDEERRRKEEALRLQREKDEEARLLKIREEEERRLRAEAERKQKEEEERRQKEALRLQKQREEEERREKARAERLEKQEETRLHDEEAEQLVAAAAKLAARGEKIDVDHVQFTLFRRSAVRPKAWYPLLVFAHLAERRGENDPDPIAEVQAQARRMLGDDFSAFRPGTEDSAYPVAREAELRFVPQMPGVTFNPPERTCRWTESVHREDFRMMADQSLDGRVARGRVSVFNGSLLLADVHFSVRVDGNATGVQQEKTQARPYRRIFASYSHRDTAIVQEFESHAAATGDQYVRDVVSLRAGETWDKRLLELMDQADVFQLFWSWNSLGSPLVREEWRHALSLNRPHFIRPVYWEEPMPEKAGLPPQELRRLHFQRVYPRLVEPVRAPAASPAPVVPAPAIPAPAEDESIRTDSASEIPLDLSETFEVSRRGKFGTPLPQSSGKSKRLVAFGSIAAAFVAAIGLTYMTFGTSPAVQDMLNPPAGQQTTPPGDAGATTPPTTTPNPAPPVAGPSPSPVENPPARGTVEPAPPVTTKPEPVKPEPVEPEPNNPPPKPTTKPTKPVVVAPTPPAGGAAAGRRGTAPPPARQGGGAETPTTTTPPVAQVQPPVNPPTQTPTPTPPMKEPVETPAPAPPVTKPTPPPDSGKPQVLSPAQEEQRIRTALEQYENAYDTLNASAVRAIFPGAPATLEKAFAQYEFYRLELVVQRIRLAPDGMSATAECTLSHFFRPRVGRDQDFRRNQEFTFQKRGNSWIIVRVR